MKEESSSKEIKKITPENRRTMYYEYVFYSSIAIISCLYCTIKLAKISYDFSKKTFDISENSFIKPDNIFGGSHDFNDSQWRGFRSNIFIIFIFAAVFITISTLLKRLTNLITLKIFYLIAGIGFNLFLHRIGSLIMFIFITVFYLFSLLYHLIGRKAYITITWVYCIGLKMISEKKSGFIPIIKEWNIFGEMFFDISLDWHSAFGLLFLRLISFNIEYANAIDGNTKSNNIKDIEQISAHCDKCKQGKFCLTALKFTYVDIKDFNFLNLLIYIYYPPLYMAGPTMLFNSFMFQVNTGKNNHHNDFLHKDKIIYFFRVLLTMTIMELFNHFIYTDAIIAYAFDRFRQENSYFYYYFLAQNSLMFTFLKYAVMWKFARLWSWFNGILTEENINRCIYNNYSFEGFWRAWHRSFNIWLIRYMYIPLGGKDKKFLNTFVVFSFVALWHDLSFHLLYWAWIIYITLIPEIIVKTIFNKPKMQYLNNYMWFRYLKMLSCCIIVLLMITANLIGFESNMGKIKDTLGGLWEDLSFSNFVLLLLFYFPYPFFMFFIREVEEMNGIKKNF